MFVAASGLNGGHLRSVKSKAKAIVDMTLDNNNKSRNSSSSWPKVKCFVGNCRGVARTFGVLPLVSAWTGEQHVSTWSASG